MSEFLISIGFEKCACDRVTLVVSSLWKAEFSSVWLVVMWMILCFVVYLDVRHGENLRKQIRERFKWGTWKKDHFVQCGVEISRLPCGGFSLGQTQYIDDLKGNSDQCRKAQESEGGHR